MARLFAVVDDDISVRKSLDRLIRSVRLEVRTFASAEEFLNSADPRKPDCLILNVRLPRMSLLIFITAHEFDNLERLKAASDRAVTYFAKPFSGDELDAVNWPLQRDTRRLETVNQGESHE